RPGVRIASLDPGARRALTARGEAIGFDRAVLALGAEPLRLPLPGVRARLIPTAEELAACRALGESLACHLTGRIAARTIDLAELT
ncbi:MAG: hypothetical protein N2690_09660, partial [Rhodocyclaceae bacterium]|nr:hypothetical protein [Rhodocyclaceae bacterium]